MRVLPILVLALLVSSSGAEALGAQQPASDPLQAAAWMSGCWESRRGERVITEMWMAPAGGLMLGASRTVAGTSVREFEFLRIRAREGRLVYTAIPSGQKETDFTTAPAPSVGAPLVFENPAHDFPQRITYRRAGADSAYARVEGPGQGGAMRGFEIPMRRVSCAPPEAPRDTPPA